MSDNPQTESAPIDESLEQAPSFTLPTVGGGTASLDSYLGQRNVVLVFYRAFW
ncbi:MAG: redoxin domain-containing protein [Chloroflexi bacterium]|nr:redoxin domain-containing protein [Chloroflexota bacterium]MCI0865313.1 redoxin domain-containing protein [Chloroflexota bacterium]